MSRFITTNTGSGTTIIAEDCDDCQQLRNQVTQLEEKYEKANKHYRQEAEQVLNATHEILGKKSFTWAWDGRLSTLMMWLKNEFSQLEADNERLRESLGELQVWKDDIIKNPEKVYF